jgi:C_GCAxxG_C_C family probable redox protein
MHQEPSQSSRELFDNGYYCAESVLMALAEYQGIESDLIPQIATGFCSGVSRTGGVCGAVNGAIMGISLAAGRKSPDNSVERCYILVRTFVNQFEEKHKSTNCGQLLGCDLATDEGQHTFKAKHLITRCQQYVEDAAGIAAKIISEDQV